MQMSFDKVLASLQTIGEVLIKRGSAMGPLVPLLFLIPIFFGTAWLFRSTFLVRDWSIISLVLVVAALWIVRTYLRHYDSFAKNDPDRLQSEEYRYGMARMQTLSGKGLQGAIPAEDLTLEDPRENPAEPKPSSQKGEPPTQTDIEEENSP